MKESIAQTFIVNLIIFFFGILVLLYFGSINYSKAFKCKNRIVTIIEKYDGNLYTPTGDLNSSDARLEIENNLAKAGYQTSNNFMTKCEELSGDVGGTLVFPTPEDKSIGRGYNYCVIRINSGTIHAADTSKACVTSDSCYYQVVTFMEFHVPVISGFLKFPVRGETRTFSEISS